MESLEKLGLNVQGDEAFLPHYEEVAAINSHYPLQLMPYGIINLSFGRWPNPPYLYKTILDNMLLKKDSFIEINPETARKYRLAKGDLVIVESRRGSLQARVNIFEGARPGVIFMPMGFGHTGFDDYNQNKGVNPNNIVGNHKDPLSGLSAWWDTGVRIRKV